MPRHVEFQRLHNFRDLGGYPTADGRGVAWGRLYRSDSLGRLARANGGTEADWDRYLALGVRTVVDLRHGWEIEAKGRVPEHDGLTYHHLPIEHRPFDQVSLGPEVEPGRYLADRFAETAADGVRELAQVLRVLAAGPTPVVFHCASGKDRTGIVAALTLTLLGVAEHDVVADFTLTERARDRLVADWLAEHPGRTPAWPHFNRTPPEIMRTFLSDLRAIHGSLHRYAERELGLDDSVIRQLRSTYTSEGRAPS